MAWDLEKLSEDSIAARSAAISTEAIVSKFVNGKIQGVAYSAGQKTALLTAFTAQVEATKTYNDAIQAQIDAN